jgi:hypothetical protein
MLAMRAIGGAQRAAERARFGDGQATGVKAHTSSPGFPAFLGAAANASDAQANPQAAATFTSAGERPGLPVRSSRQEPDASIDDTAAHPPGPIQTTAASDPGAVAGDQLPLAQHAPRGSQARLADLAPDLDETPLSSDLVGPGAARSTGAEVGSGRQALPARPAGNTALRDGIGAAAIDSAPAPLPADLTSGDTNREAGIGEQTQPGHSRRSGMTGDSIASPVADPTQAAGFGGITSVGPAVLRNHDATVNPLGRAADMPAPSQDSRRHRSSRLKDDPEIEFSINNAVAGGIAPALQGSDHVLQAPADEVQASLVVAVPVSRDSRRAGMAVTGTRPEATDQGDPASYTTSTNPVATDPAFDPASADDFTDLRAFNPTSEVAMHLPADGTVPEAQVNVNSVRPHSNSRAEDQPAATSGAPSAIDPSGTPANSSLDIDLRAGPSGDLAASGLSLTDLAGNLSSHVTRLADNGGHQVVLRLHPPELGDLTVRVLVSGRDVSAWFASPHVQVQQTISAAIGQLHADLGNAGYNLNGAWVGTDAAGTGERERSPTARQHQRNATGQGSIEEARDLPASSASSRVSVYV